MTPVINTHALDDQTAPPSPPEDDASSRPVTTKANPTSASASASASANPVSPPDQEPSHLPNVNLLPRPEELLLHPPYHLLITQDSSIQIQCNHGPSLGFLDEYLRKWCRTNSQRTNRPPIIQVTLAQSPFGLGPLHDVLTLQYPAAHFHGSPPVLSVPIVLHLVESVLGYRLVYSDAKNWQYRRDTPLRRM
ncbi:hypothetical protein E4U21_001565 [Claviceps maximensis]|nr:hypothetical protein E4U21_001565 [Claviceps maximensis]